MAESNDGNDIAQSITLSSQQDDEHCAIQSKCNPLVEQLAQAKATKQCSNKDVQSLQLSEQETMIQEKNHKISVKQNFHENSKSPQVQQGSNNISPTDDSIDKMTSNTMLSLNAGS